MSLAAYLLVALVGGLMSLDSVSVGQTMISRPIVAATVVGALLGAVETGLMIGAILELLALETMPFGASRYLEWSSGAVVASAAAVVVGGPDLVVLMLAVLIAVPVAWLAGVSMVVMRRFNGRLVAARRSAVELGDSQAVAGLQLAGVSADFLRGTLIAATGLLLAIPACSLLVTHLSFSPLLTIVPALALPAGVALAAGWRAFASHSRRRYLMLAGMILGLALILVL
jgi:mannose/fructose/N-acetylgalactosamine-specific phosphotransferase system component IIC